MKKKSIYDDFEPSILSREESGWISAHWPELQEKYAGEWIAVWEDKVIAHGEKLVEVGAEAAKLGVSAPFYEWVPPKNTEPYILLI